MQFFDTHAHLNDPQLLEREAEIIAEAESVGVQHVVAVGTDLPTTRQSIEIARRHDSVYATAGIHPNSCHRATLAEWQELLQLTGDPQVVALGETGLDCYWDDCPLETQEEWFVRHIQLSHETGLPLVVHMRESEQQILSVFNQHHRDKRINGIMHSFTGSLETATTCLDYGMYISFAGMITFKNAGNLRQIAAQIPPDRILIETDSPYLTPHPFRGRRPNEPRMVRHTAQCLADVRQMDLETVARITTENAKRVFQLTD